MSISKNIAKHFKEVFLGGNWTTSNLKSQLEDVTFSEALHQIEGFNNIATLTNHLSYYIPVLRKVLESQPLVAKDEWSFAHPEFTSEAEWQAYKEQIWHEVEVCCKLIEALPEHIYWEDFTDSKYGIYYRNIHGIIEHAHYHLGQIAWMKKMIRK